MRFGILVTLWLVIMIGNTALAGDGSVCLGRNLSVALTEHSERLYLTIGDSPPIFFYKPAEPPRIVARGLDRAKRYPVKVFFDGKVMHSWYLDFKKLGHPVVNIWRAKGSWRMEPSVSGRCTWPPE